MLFSSQIPLPRLIDLCHLLRHNLDAGLTLVRVFEQQSQRGSEAVRPMAGRVAALLKRGESLEKALADEKALLPPLFLALVAVGEQTGNLPEVLEALEAFYRTQLKLRRELISRSTMPALQLIVAILVIAGLIYVLGLIGSMNNTKPMDPLGIGLTGTSGALIFLTLAFGSIAGLVAAYILAGKMRGRAGIDRFLLRVPAIGPCLYAIALSRFCLALRVTSDTSIPVGDGLRLSLRATDNAAFVSEVEAVRKGVRAGKGVAETLGRTGLLDSDFQTVLYTAEEAGRMSEVMRQQAKYYEEIAGQRLALLMRAAGFAVWASVAILIVIAIVRIYMTMYIGPLNQF